MRSQDLEVGRAEEVWGRKTQAGSRAEPWWGPGGEGERNPPAESRGQSLVGSGVKPQKPDMHIQSAVDKRICVMCSIS